MKPRYLLAKAKHHLGKGTLVNTIAQRLFNKEPFTKAVNTPLYNLVYGRMVGGKIREFTEAPSKACIDINIETTNVCNAKCVFCPRNTMTRETGFMDMRTFRGIVDKIKQSRVRVRSITLNGFGEPLIDPGISERIKYIKENLDCGTIFFTNAALLDERKSGEIIRSGLDEMNLSFNGVSKEEYEKTMVNLKFERVEENIINFMKKRKETGYSKPYVYMSCIYTDRDFDKKEFLDKWGNIVDSIFIMPAEKWGSLESEDIPYEKLPYKPKEWPCKRLWTNLWIAWNGDVYICCKDYNGSTVMGNLREKTLDEVWNGGKFRRFRELHTNNQFDRIPICKGCGALIRNSVLWWTAK
ncbi:MAG: SPASM domain-containing protein [Candidatus Altiarchaeota archaeon]|nr:SPASM domain-containing protein [Candidatus Altiarchaeota archaeon]